MQRVIIIGSPRNTGRSVMLAEEIFEDCIDTYPDDEVILIPLFEISVGACQGCMSCRKKVDIHYFNPDGKESIRSGYRCIFDDDMAELYDLFESADELIIVTPVYFSGNTSLLKAMLDRMQPYYWDTTQRKIKRPALLHVVGEGGDPYGYSPLVTEIASALGLAGFSLEKIVDWVGKIDDSNEITEDGKQYTLKEYFQFDTSHFRSRFLDSMDLDINQTAKTNRDKNNKKERKKESRKSRNFDNAMIDEKNNHSNKNENHGHGGNITNRPRLKLGK